MQPDHRPSDGLDTARLRPPARKDEHGGRADAGKYPPQSNHCFHPAPESGRHGGATPRPAPPPVRLGAKPDKTRLRGGPYGPACLRAILAENKKLTNYNHSSHTVKLYPGMVTIEPKQKPRVGAGPVYVDTEEGFVKQVGIDSACPVPGRSSATNKREKIKQFSTKSRRRLIKALCRFPHSWRFRFELTFTDDVMEGKTVEERAKLDTWCFIERKTL